MEIEANKNRSILVKAEWKHKRGICGSWNRGYLKKERYVGHHSHDLHSVLEGIFSVSSLLAAIVAANVAAYET